MLFEGDTDLRVWVTSCYLQRSMEIGEGESLDKRYLEMWNQYPKRLIMKIQTYS